MNCPTCGKPMPKKAEKQMPRAVRNNNPGNIEKGIRWRGLASDQPDSRFAKFEDAKWGARAMCKIFATYRRRYQRVTLRQIIERWAPPVENNTDGYVRIVAKRMAIDPDSEIKPDQYPMLAQAMSFVEVGFDHWPAQVFHDGYQLA